MFGISVMMFIILFWKNLPWIEGPPLVIDIRLMTIIYFLEKRMSQEIVDFFDNAMKDENTSVTLTVSRKGWILYPSLCWLAAANPINRFEELMQWKAACIWLIFTLTANIFIHFSRYFYPNTSFETWCCFPKLHRVFFFSYCVLLHFHGFSITCCFMCFRGKMGASLHRLSKDKGRGGKPPYLTVVASFQYRVFLAAVKRLLLK